MPPKKRAYDHFCADAKDEIRNNRPGWTSANVRHTLSTIWAGNATVTAYYATFKGKKLASRLDLPIPNPIPDVPYDENDVARAKATVPLPAPSAAQSPPHDAVDGTPPGGGDQDPVVAAPTQDVGADNAQRIDQLPYSFWPQLPWDADPDLPAIDAETLKRNKCAKHAWLDRVTHKPDGDERTWHGTKSLGIGSYGAAGLWLQIDATNNVLDVSSLIETVNFRRQLGDELIDQRMVIKDTLRASAHTWRDPKNWRDGLPREIRVHQLIEERRTADPILDIDLVPMRNFRLIMALRKYRIYLDFCAGGDSWHAMHDVDANWENEDELNLEVFIPQGYVWYMIRALASACLVLQNGTIAEERIANWKLITHLDLHLGNVLLDIKVLGDTAEKEASTRSKGLEGKGKQPTTFEDASTVIPPVVPMLTDFGISFFSPGISGCPLSDNPEDYIFNDVKAPYPPEMQVQNGPTFTKLGEKTDVWGSGHIAWTLLVNRLKPGCPVRDNKGKKKDLEGKYMTEYGGFIPLSLDLKINKVMHNQSAVLTRGAGFPAVKEYSDPKLLAVVRSCLNYHPDSRPTLRQIYHTAQDSLQNSIGDEDRDGDSNAGYNAGAYDELMDK